MYCANLPRLCRSGFRTTAVSRSAMAGATLTLTAVRHPSFPNPIPALILQSRCCSTGSSRPQLLTAKRHFSTSRVCRFSPTSPLDFNRRNDQITGFTHITVRPPGEDDKDKDKEEPDYGGPGEGYLPFPPPFHTINIMAFLLIANVLCYVVMNYIATDSLRDFLVEHLTLSIHNAYRIYPLLTQSLYQEHLLQLAIDCWLLWQFGAVMLGFLGGKRLLFFWALCTMGGSFLHIGRQYFELNYLKLDPLDVRGRCFGPNPFILGLVAVEGLIFRRLNFMQSPPVPFLVLTAFVMVIDVWRVFTTRPEEHGASTGGALVAYLFWRLPTRRLGLDRLTATM